MPTWLSTGASIVNVREVLAVRIGKGAARTLAVEARRAVRREVDIIVSAKRWRYMAKGGMELIERASNDG